MPATTKKTFDAVEMSRRLREQTSRRLAALSREQLLERLNAHIRPGAGKLAVREEAAPYAPKEK